MSLTVSVCPGLCTGIQYIVEGSLQHSLDFLGTGSMLIVTELNPCLWKMYGWRRDLV